MINNPNAYQATEWLDYAVCTVPNAPTMFPGEGDRPGIEIAKAACAICPVLAECLKAALDRGEKWGIWGGMTPEERASFRRKRQRNGKAITELQLPDVG